MTNTTIVERDVYVPTRADGSRTPFSWSAAIAGTFAAVAVTYIIAALGSGIGLSFASPYGSGPSATSLTAAAAVWLVMAQAMGFATGGYLAGRLRSPAYDGVLGETTFRDAAQGFLVWAIGAVVMAAALALLAYFAASATTRAAAGAVTAAATRDQAAATSTAATGTATTDYFVDLLFRPGPTPATANGARPADTVGVAPAGAQPALSPETRAEASRVLLRSISEGRLDDGDRTYLAQLVSARTGLPPDQAERRVADVEAKARAAVKETADKAAKAGAYFSFWTFMSLLFGAAAATLGGMLGGQLRDAEGRLAPG
ncbi:MAG TPA: hypothetical protein VH934_21145 [Xanthobacteraceae bacterium]|jgi:hypothetical protein